MKGLINKAAVLNKWMDRKKKEGGLMTLGSKTLWSLKSSNNDLSHLGMHRAIAKMAFNQIMKGGRSNLDIWTEVCDAKHSKLPSAPDSQHTA